MGYDIPADHHGSLPDPNAKSEGLQSEFDRLKRQREEIESRDLSLATIIRQSISRAKRWHEGDLHQWSTLEWAGAAAGETGETADAVMSLLLTMTRLSSAAGETANTAKKLRRLELNIASINADSRHFPELDAAKAAVIKECADTIFYALLTAATVNEQPEAIIAVLRTVFNQKSEEYGFPERI